MSSYCHRLHGGLELIATGAATDIQFLVHKTFLFTQFHTFWHKNEPLGWHTKHVKRATAVASEQAACNRFTPELAGRSKGTYEQVNDKHFSKQKYEQAHEQARYRHTSKQSVGKYSSKQSKQSKQTSKLFTITTK